MKLGKSGSELLETAGRLAGEKQQNWLVHGQKKEDGYTQSSSVGFVMLALIHDLGC